MAHPHEQVFKTRYEGRTISLKPELDRFKTTVNGFDMDEDKKTTLMSLALRGRIEPTYQGQKRFTDTIDNILLQNAAYGAAFEKFGNVPEDPTKFKEFVAYLRTTAEEYVRSQRKEEEDERVKGL